MFTVLFFTALVELALYAKLRRDRAEALPRTARRQLVAQKGRPAVGQLKPRTLRSAAA